MYYAEVQLTADFDLSAILTPEGSLNFGHVEDENYASYIDAYLGAAGENTEDEAIERLCSYMYEKAHIIPVVYRQNAVVTHREEISNFKPTQSNLFYNTTALEITPK